MAPPVLLVADDLSIIASVKRVLGREGYEVILATSAADAVIAWGHHLPGLVVVQPSVESGRGEVLLEELRAHPDAQLLRVVLLGESIPGFGYHVEPLPLDAEQFARTLQSQLRAAEDGAEWTVTEPSTAPMPTTAPPMLDEPEPWRATRPPSMTPDDALPQTHELIESAAPTPPDAAPPMQASPSVMTRLFGDLPSLEDEVHRDVEAQALATLESSLPPLATDDEELQRLEDEVRAEAARRRAAREAQSGAPVVMPPPVQPYDSGRFDELPGDESTAAPSAETSFADVGTTPPDGAEDPTAAAGEESPASETDDAAGSGYGAQAGHDQLASGGYDDGTGSGQGAPNGDEARPGYGQHGVTASDQDQDSAAEHDDFTAAGRDDPGVAGDHRAAATSPASALPPPDSATAREVLARAEAIAHESRAVSKSQQKATDAERRRAEGELDGLKRRADHAETLVRRERDARAAVEDELEQLREEHRTLAAQLEAERVEGQARASSDLEAVAAQAQAREEALTTAITALEQRLAEQTQAQAANEELRAQLEARVESAELAVEDLTATATERAAERESLLESLTHEQEAARRAEGRAGELEAQLTARVADLREVREQLALAAGTVKDLTAQLEEAQLAALAAEEAREELSAKLEDAVARAGAAKGEAEVAEKVVQELTASLEAARAELASTQEALEAARAEAERERQRAVTQAKDVAAFKESLEAQRARADEAEALAQLTTERLKALEHRQVMNLALPGRRALGLPRSGTVTLEQLAHVVSTLAAAQADVRLELGVRGGTRVIWFKKGALHGAESSFDHESLIDRARRDGLIDARQEAELRLMRTAAGVEQLEALKARGYLREIETVPLLQRATEAVALEAFSEDTTQYRLSDEPPGANVLLVAVPRPTLPLLAEALRRAVPADALLETLGGAEAICIATDADVDLRAMGFGDKERKMLSWVDGEASVEDLTLAAGMKQESAFRALVVAKLLGVIEVKPPETPVAAPSGDLDLRRLEAKYDEVQDADYFTILGLPRTASSDEVQRAFRRLSEEFDPIKYTGHPDASLQQRAQVVHGLLEEAARALDDERRRAEYARHLLD